VRDLVILGAGGHGRELLDIVLAMNADDPRWNVVGFLAADNDHPERVAARGLEVLGDESLVGELRCDYVVGIGNPATRRRVDVAAERAGGTPVTLVHPTAIVGGASTIGPGCVLAANAVVTTNVVLGRSVHVNVGASVSHDCRLGDYTILAPGVRLAGGVTTGEGVDLGVGAVVRPATTLGDGAVVGAGAAVVADVEPGAVVAGVPARRLR
jgi:sugar O-acyltransferase (sialic acid O-acetyltransferase NeuD family)